MHGLPLVPEGPANQEGAELTLAREGPPFKDDATLCEALPEVKGEGLVATGETGGLLSLEVGGEQVAILAVQEGTGTEGTQDRLTELGLQEPLKRYDLIG